MKNIIIAALCAISLTSCFKAELDPVTGYNSVLQFNDIEFFNVPGADSIVGEVGYVFTLSSDTAASGVDTLRFDHRFAVKSSKASQRIDFNTPGKALSAVFSVRFRMYRGTADSVHVQKFVYEKDGQTKVQQSLFFNTKDSVFATPPITVQF